MTAVRLVQPNSACNAGTRAPKLKLSELNAIPLITMPEATSPRGRAELMHALASVGITPEVHVEASDPALLLALVEARVGFAVLRIFTGSLFPPSALHWAANGTGVIVGFFVNRRLRTQAEAAAEPPTP